MRSAMRVCGGILLGAFVAGGCAAAPVPPSIALARHASADAGPALTDAGAGHSSGGLFRLPEGVRPTAQTVSLRVDPAGARFAGSVDVALRIERPVGDFWVSARELHLQAASLERGAERWPVTLEPDDARGAARIVLGRTVPPGDAVLHVEFDAAFNPRLVGLY